jgi:hypothetical protein
MYCWIKQCGVVQQQSTTQKRSRASKSLYSLFVCLRASTMRVQASPPADCFNGTLLCQNGANECLANRIEGCANSLAKDAQTGGLFTVCFEGLFTSEWQSSTAPIVSAASECANKLGIKTLSECYKVPMVPLSSSRTLPL